jgi:AcrR family transcriptional regulator
MATSPHKLRTIPARPAGRRERHRTQTRDRLYQSALALFAERGFLKTTVEDITEAADVGKGTFFNYFPTKEHILAEFGGGYVAAMERSLEEARRTKGPIMPVIHELATIKVGLINENDALIRAIYSAHASCESVRRELKNRIDACRRSLTEIMKIAQGRGEVRSDVSAAELARSAQITFMGVSMGWAIYPHSTLRKVLEETWALLEPGLRGSGSVPATGRRRKSK